MSTTRRITFKLYPTTTQEKMLFEWKSLHCWVYNKALANRRDSWQKNKQSVNYFDQQKTVKIIRVIYPEFKPLGSHAIQDTLKRNGQGETIEEAKESLKNAIQLILEDRLIDIQRGLPKEAIKYTILIP